MSRRCAPASPAWPAPVDQRAKHVGHPADGATRRDWLAGLGGAFMLAVVPSRPVWAAPASAPAPMSAPDGLVSLPDGRQVAPDIARIVRRGELVVAMNAADNFPLFYMRQGELAGYDVQLMQGLARALGVAVRFDRSSKTFDGVVDLVAQGEADLAVGRLARTFNRAQRVQFSSTYLKLEHALLIHRLRFAELARDRPLPAAVRDFTGTLGVIKGSAWDEFARLYFTKARIVAFATWKDAVDAVKQGEVVAVYRDEYEVKSILKQDKSLALILRTVTFDDLQSHWAVMVGMNARALLNVVNEYLEQRTAKPTMKDMLREMK